jgi:hypothetical protein
MGWEKTVAFEKLAANPEGQGPAECGVMSSCVKVGREISAESAGVSWLRSSIQV